MTMSGLWQGRLLQGFAPETVATICGSGKTGTAGAVRFAKVPPPQVRFACGPKVARAVRRTSGAG